MAIAHVQSQGFISASTTSFAFTIPTPTTGNLMVIWAANASTTTITVSSPAGWTPMTSITSGSGGTARNFRGFYKIAAAGESTSVTLAGANVWGVGYSEYSGVDNVTPLLVENAQANASGTVTTPNVTPTAALSVVLSAAYYIRGIATLSAEQLTPSATSLTERVDTAQNNAAGNGQSIGVADLLVASTSGSYQGTATASAAAVGAGGIAIFQAAAPAAVALPPLPTVVDFAVARASNY